ncbi:hypothetical protein L228DRAFT_238236 [Xylona heveae TC161]|uniref:Uncharacterized protein n=1 Tax=Xylona heveae (strain CBS 132557 / TC161) TaxID=1328760 RepID=A0A161TD10_XYLHT|nr:hypothetical protein L228DRAFT_238236 [Xylona heveae TC161]KZF23707.1 hypothetical protein L228DRAFT_238236 [Xylona heveae TC161]
MPGLPAPPSTASGPSFNNDAMEFKGKDGSSHSMDSPPRPPVSPITPVIPLATLADPPARQGPRIVPPGDTEPAGPSEPSSDFIPQPPSEPISEVENPDAIALRSAISILQIQKQRSKEDIKTLERLKQAALRRPEAFAQELATGRIGRTQGAGTLGDLVSSSNANSASPEKDDEDENEDEEEEEEEKEESGAEFGNIPAPQNVIRCPPINWAQYHVVGESLDKLHEEQRARPSPGEPQRDNPADRHVIAAPYRPLVDKVDPPMRTRSVSRRE